MDKKTTGTNRNGIAHRAYVCVCVCVKEIKKWKAHLTRRKMKSNAMKTHWKTLLDLVVSGDTATTVERYDSNATVVFLFASLSLPLSVCLCVCHHHRIQFTTTVNEMIFTAISVVWHHTDWTQWVAEPDAHRLYPCCNSYTTKKTETNNSADESENGTESNTVKWRGRRQHSDCVEITFVEHNKEIRKQQKKLIISGRRKNTKKM